MIFRSYFVIENEEGSNFGGEDRPNAINQDISSTGKCFSLLTLVPAKPWAFLSIGCVIYDYLWFETHALYKFTLTYNT